MTEATNGYKRQHGLTIEQRNAIDVLLAGKTDQATAEAVGVNRVTITKWRLYDPWFLAELNRRRQELWCATAERLRAMLPRALDVIAQSLNSDGADALRAATQVIRLAGVDRLDPPTGPTDPAEIMAARVEARAAEKRRLREEHQSASEWGDAEHTPGLKRKLAEQDEAAAREEIETEIADKLKDDAEAPCRSSNAPLTALLLSRAARRVPVDP